MDMFVSLIVLIISHCIHTPKIRLYVSVKVKVTQSCPTLQPMAFSRPEYWVGSRSLLQRIFPTQEMNQGLLNYSWILYQLSYQGSPVCLKHIQFLCVNYTSTNLNNYQKYMSFKVLWRRLTDGEIFQFLMTWNKVTFINEVSVNEELSIDSFRMRPIVLSTLGTWFSGFCFCAWVAIPYIISLNHSSLLFLS